MLVETIGNARGPIKRRQFRLGAAFNALNPAFDFPNGTVLFTEEGKRYVGDRRTKCNFAYLERPRIENETPIRRSKFARSRS